MENWANIFSEISSLTSSPHTHICDWNPSRPEPAKDDSEVFTYIDRSLLKVRAEFSSDNREDDFAISPDVIDRMKAVLFFACDHFTVFPKFSPDGEGGLAASWHAVDRFIQITVDDDLATDFYCVQGRQVENIQVDLGVHSGIGELRQRLIELSDNVRSQNPWWRNLFVET